MTDFIEELLLEAEQNEKKLQLAHADILVSEIKNIQSQIESNFKQADEEKKIIGDWVMSKNLKLQERIERITTQLELFMNDQDDKVKTIDLPNGKLLKRKQPDKIEIVDLENFLLNADRSMISLQPEIVKPDLNKIKAFYKRTLKLPEGTKLIEGKEKFSIKLINNKEQENGKKETGVGTEQSDSLKAVV